MRRISILVLIIFIWFDLAVAATNTPINPLPSESHPDSHSYDYMRDFLQKEDAAREAEANPYGFVVSGGLHGTAGGMAATAFATTAYTSSRNRIRQTAAAINYTTQGCASTSTAWVLISSGTATPIGTFVRVAGTQYFTDCTTGASQPALPADTTLLMKVTLTGGAIAAVVDLRRPASFAHEGVYSLTDPLYGGGTTASATANAAALQAACNGIEGAGGGTLWIPRGIYQVDRPAYCAASNIIISGYGTLQATADFPANNSTNRGILTLGQRFPGSPAVAVSNIVIRHIIFDGQFYATPLYVANCSDCLIQQVTAKNSDAGVIRIYSSGQVAIAYSQVSGGRGIYGDGIYCGGITECRVLYNTINDYTRIGIVSEQEGSTKTGAFWAVGNTVAGAHDASGGQNNAGIWSENTRATYIIGNLISDQWDNPPDIFSSRCIMLASLQGGGLQTFEVQGNTISGCLAGVWIEPNINSQIRVSGIKMRKGTVTAIQYGIVINNGSHIILNDIQIGDNAYPGGGAGILYNNQSASDIQHLSISNVTSGEEGTPTYATGLGDIVIYSNDGGGGLNELVLSKLQNIRLVMRIPVANIIISDSTVTAAGNAYLTYPSQFAKISNSTITQVGTGTQIFNTPATSTTELYNVTAHALTPKISNTSAGSPAIFRVIGGIWDQASHIDIDGEFITDFANIRWTDFPTDGTGAIQGNITTGYAWRLTVRNVDFGDGGSFDTPIVMTADPATSVFAVGNTWTGNGQSIYGLPGQNILCYTECEGSGTPEGQVTGRVGAVFHRWNGGASTSIYVKESGDNTNSGWVAK